MGKIQIVGESFERLGITSPMLPRVDPAAFASALGVEPCGDAHVHLDMISLGELGNALIQQGRSAANPSDSLNRPV